MAIPMARIRMFVFGASGHAKVVADIIEDQATYEIAFIIDDAAAVKGTSLLDAYPVLGNREDLVSVLKAKAPNHSFVAIGKNSIRRDIAGWLSSQGFQFATPIHPTATCGRRVEIGQGTVLMPRTLLNADTKVGQHCIVNSGAQVDHDCRIGDFVHLAPGVVVCGGVSIGNNCLIGANSTILPTISIGDDVVVGAGSTVVENIPSGLTVIGTPAKPQQPT